MRSLIACCLLLGTDGARVNTKRAGLDTEQSPDADDILRGSGGGFDYDDAVEDHDDGNGTPFERYIHRSEETACLPKLLRSTCSDSDLRGVVVFFHGYSSCSIQALAFSDELTRNCYDILAPTYPGHGRFPVQCSNANCDVEWDNGQGWTHSDLPTHYSGYQNWADEALRVIKSEFEDRAQAVGKSEAELEAHVIGLSFGVPMALYAARTNPGFFSRQLLLNPYMALGDEEIDQAAAECEERAGNDAAAKEECERETVLAWLSPAGITDHENPFVRILIGDEPDEVVQSLFTTLVKISDAFGQAYRPGGARDVAADAADAGMLDTLMQDEIKWNYNCPGIFQHRAGGFCMFKKKHYLSTHSFAMHEVVELQYSGAWPQGVPTTQITTTERDGRTRNGISYHIARHLRRQEGGETSMCMNHFRRGTDRTNAGQYWNDENSLPHATLRPDMSWWGADLKRKIREFITTNTPTICDSSEWDGSREQYVMLPIERNSMDRHPELSALVNPDVSPTSRRNLWPGLIVRGLRVFMR